MDEENIIDDLISENRNEFDEITSRSTFIFEELSNKCLTESASNSESTKQSEPIVNNTENNVQTTDENDENALNSKKDSTPNPESKMTRPCQFAISRIKTIMKMDPELALASKESVFLICKATELFVDFISTEAYKFTNQGNRKTLQKKDIDSAVNSVDSLCFLDAALD